MQPRGGYHRTTVLLLLRTAWSAACAVVLVVSGVAWSTVSTISTGVERSYAIPDDAPRSESGRNILIMGLTTRLDLHGDPLPDDVLRRMQAGESDRGGYNANTLILLRIPDSGPAIAMSVPRDNLVPLSSGGEGKIKEAYGRAKIVEEDRLRAAGTHDRRALERAGREAGRRAQVRTVSAFLDQPVDHLVEISLIGFFHIAEGLGGVDVCLRRPAKDPLSGADFPAGPQHLDAGQALSFVRQRHGLPNGDLDRTRRQQAFLSAVAKRLEGADVTAVQAMVDMAKQDVVLDARFDLVEFARNIPAEVRFDTLPIEGGAHLGGLDVNKVDQEEVRAKVAELASAPPPPPPNDGVPCVD
ncbi:LCP family protein [Lentzea jiangxiensis]|uniref:Cell envelope-related function transcriptional attenuator common domain-containing protein n=1 Tax=Lentzea jiangxiensis TaxID=641025 RepID=A0A1H0U5V0_9PSEU|nr:LCP family protein [Lentzea jiangxiensis]SDP61196.1 cell envelope-related function transcriptional attenuator common domain-containing protein [Lentzea jiangxiensis]